MNRPTGVTVIAVLCFIGACFSALLGLGLLLGAGFLTTIVHSQAGIPAGILAAAGGVLAVFALVWAALHVAVGVGLLKLKEWARIVAIVFAALGVLTGLGALLHFHPLSLLHLAVAGWALWYLLQPHVVAAFKGAPPIPTAVR